MLDFDEILLSVKNPQIQKYLEEAIKSYRIGNYRSAILAVWVATMFDLVKKFEILVEQREPTAMDKWKSLEPKIKDHQNWEQALIHAAKVVDMISRYEADTLESLSKTRNRYAHPSFDEVGALFDPTPEEVRYFIRTLYDIVFSQPAQLGAFYVNQLIESLKDPNLFSAKLFADELVLEKDLVIKKVNRINKKQLPRLVKELFQALNSPINKEHELNILCFIVNLCGAEIELQIPVNTAMYWDDYILDKKLSVRILDSILNYPEYLNQLSEQSQQSISEFLRDEYIESRRHSESFVNFLAYADVVPLAKSLLDDAPNLIPIDEAIRQSWHYSGLFGSKFREIFGEAIFKKTREVLRTRNGYEVNPALSALRSCGIWNMGDLLSLPEQRKFANELILSLNSNNWATMSLLSFHNRSDIPIKWIKLLLEQWDENVKASPRFQRSLPEYLEHYLGLVERYIVELGNCPLLENAIQVVVEQTIKKEPAVGKTPELSELNSKLAAGEASNALEKVQGLSPNEELWTFWRRLLSEYKHLITSTPLEAMI